MPDAGARSGGRVSRCCCTVCIVDDDPSVCDSLSVMLSAFGFSTRTYASGRDYLDDPRHGDAAYLVIDQHMPNVTGLEVVSALRGEGVTTPVVLITGRIDDAIIGKADKLDISSVLEKPFAASRLIQLLESRLGRESGPHPG